MTRVAGLFLLALGVVLVLVGLIGAIVAINRAPAGGGGAVAGFLFLGFLGLVALIAAVAVLRRARPLGTVPAGDDGTSGPYPAKVPVTRELDGSPYTVLYTPPVPGKHAQPSSLRVSTPAAAAGEFVMVRESRFDRLCKRLGIAIEIQTGDAGFDDECYIRSDTLEFTTAYLADPVKRVAILDLRRLGFPEVTLREGTLSATWVGFTPSQHDRPELAEEVAARLLVLARNLPAHRPEFDNRTGAARKRWQVFLWVFLVGFALTILSLSAFPPVRGGELVLRGVGVGLLGLPAFALLAALALRGSSTSHHAWGTLMLGALVLVPVGSVGTVSLLNGVLDESPPVVHDAVIVEKYTTKSKGTTKYHVRCSSWRVPGQTESFQISASEYDRVTPHQSRMVVTTRAGRLGVEWLVSHHVELRPAKR